MNWDLYLTFIMAALALTLMPGPDNIFVLTESLSRGFYRGMSLSAGLASGVLVHTLLAATGIAILLREWPQLAFGIRLAGTLYLVYLAYGAWRDDAQPLPVEAQHPKGRSMPFWTSFGKGFLMNVLNPKVTLFFLALLPQFVDEEAAWSEFQQMTLMGGSFMVQAFILFTGIAKLAAYLHPYLASPKFWNYTRWLQVFVLLFIALGLWLF
jgi:threonine/homoserine/homoserine lactone efflux protein